MPDVFGCSDVSTLSECRADVLSLIPHCFYISVILPVVIYKQVVNQPRHTPIVRYPSHIARWIITILLLTMQLLLLMEGLAVSEWLPWGSHLASSAALFTTLLAIVSYDSAERMDFFGHTYVSLLYWLSVVITKSLKVGALFVTLGSPQHSIRVPFTLMEVVLETGLVVCDCYLLWKLVSYDTGCRLQYLMY